MPYTEPVDERLLEFCESDTEERAVRGVLEHGSIRSAARALSLNLNSIREPLKRAKRRAASKGWVPGQNVPTSAEGFNRGRTTTLIKGGEDDDFVLKWYRDDPDRARIAQVAQEFLGALAEDLPKEKPRKLKTKGQNEGLCNLYICTDYHLGMLAWGEETRGEDWDVRIAEDLLVKWFDAAIAQSPKGSQAVAAFLGDGIHQDGFAAVTPTSGHNLDADTRYQKIVRTWIRARRRIMRALLDKYPHVVLIEAEGNHSPATDAVMREWWSAFYENEPRVTVDTSPDPYYCVEWGQTSLFFHHGHRKKPGNIHDVFAAKFREVFGRTKHSYAHMGHLHHRDVKETNLMVVEQHRTLAAADAYASSRGWISGREAQCITYHRDYGEVGRVLITPEMLEEDAA